MKRAIIFYFLAQLASPAFAATLITVDQLKKEIVASQSERDTMIAGHLVTLELTERLSASNLAALEAQLPGPESRRALAMLADQATFLAPPAAEIPKDPAPNFAEQRNILSKTIEYVRVMQIRLPNLLAQRETIHFEDRGVITKHTCHT